MNFFYITCTPAALQRKRWTSIYPLKKPPATPLPEKGVGSQKSWCICPNPRKLCLWIQKESTHWVDSFPHFFILNTWLCCNEFLLHHLYTGGITKETAVNLNYPLKKPTAPPPPFQKRESARKKVGVSSKTVFMNTIKKSRLFSAFLHFEYMIML